MSIKDEHARLVEETQKLKTDNETLEVTDFSHDFDRKNVFFSGGVRHARASLSLSNSRMSCRE